MTFDNIRFDYSAARVLVTGGTSGIGAAIAAAYRDAGADVAIAGTRAAPSDYAEDLGGYRYHQFDGNDPASIDRLAAAQDRLDILVNSAGVALFSQGLDEYEPDHFAQSVQMHLIGVYRLFKGCSQALSASRLAGGGCVIGIASMSSYFALDTVPGYGAAKGGLVQLMKTIALHWGAHNIRANAVAAGLTESRMTAAAFTDPRYTQPTLERTPLGRLGQPVDIAGPVLFLTSPAAAFITGQTLPVDGGYTIAG